VSLHDIQAPDLIEAVIGFRQWRLADDGLRSIACDELWYGPEMVARCRADGHPLHAAPASDCSCGVYARYEPCPRTGSAGTRDYVAGAVVLWGAIELHATGMRGEYCRIVALALPLSRWGKRERVQRVAREFGVLAVPSRALRKVAAEHGAPVPRSLRPPREALPGPFAPGVLPRMVDSTRARLTQGRLDPT
jgi:hypothetical protein